MIRKVGIFSLFVLLIVILGVGAIYLKQRADARHARAEMQKRLDAISAAGQPVTAQDMAKLYPDPPPEKDAARLLAPAMNALSIPDAAGEFPFFGNGPRPPCGHPLDGKMKTNIQALLADNEAALSAIPWDSITNAWVGSGFANGFTNLTNFRLREFNQLARLLNLDAINDAQFGRGKNAGQNLRHSLDLIRLMRSDVLIHFLVERNDERQVCVALEHVLNQTELPPAELSRLQDALANGRPMSFGEALVNIRCDDLASMESSMALIRANPVPRFDLPGRTRRAWITAIKAKDLGMSLWLEERSYSDSDFVKLLDVRTEQISALKMPPPQCFAELLRIQTMITNQVRPQTLIGTWSAIWLDLPDMAQVDTEVIAKLRIAETAMAIERWRRIHDGQPPQSLSLLSPEFLRAIPSDPFDGLPLRYKKLARGYVVYSIGPDFTDDDGKEKPDDAKDSDHYDLTFMVER